jgi:hypothetical protein
VSITEEEIFCGSHTGNGSKATPKRVPLSLYLHHFYTREKRAEQPHLLDGFYPIFGFPGHILCLFVDGVCIYLCSLFFTFELFDMFLRRKPVVKSLRSKGKITLIVKISIIYEICCDKLFQWKIHDNLQIILVSKQVFLLGICGKLQDLGISLKRSRRNPIHGR